MASSFWGDLVLMEISRVKALFRRQTCRYCEIWKGFISFRYII